MFLTWYSAYLSLTMLIKLRYFSFIFLFWAPSFWAQRPITVKAEQLVNLTTQGEAWHLFDEQAEIKNQDNIKRSTPQTAFNPGYNKLYNPASVVVDLREEYQLQEMWFYDSNGKDTILVFSGVPGNWQLEKQIVTDSYRSWRELPLNFKSRLLRLEFRWPQAQVNEIVLFGKPLGTNKMQKPISVKMQKPSMDRLIGINAFVNDPLDKLEMVAGTVREYHRWQWDEGNDDSEYQGFPDGKFAFNPSYAGNWNFDEYYRQLHLRGMDVSPCLQSQPLYLRAKRDADAKPVPLKADAENPDSYRAHADYMFQFAARYGSKEVPADLLKLKPGQPVKSGLAYIHSVENWNEPDKWWRGREGYFSPFEYAAMCSADYDGHEGSLGKTAGVKNADSNLPMVMAGLASLNTEYLKGMLMWSEFNRKNGFPVDILNFHHYCNDGGGQLGRPTKAISPEVDSLKKRLKRLVAFRDKFLPGKPIWLSEFGYDTNPASVQGVPATNAEEKQAQWLIRSFLEIAASGIDRAQVFMFRDVNAENPVKYNSSGITQEKWNKHRPKKAFYYLAAFQELMTGYYFKREIESGLEKVNRYEFYNPDSNTYLWAIWSYDDESELRLLNLKLPGKSVREYRLQPNIAEAEVTIPKHNQRKLKLEVGNMPVFLSFRK